jgi:hypothetical protein
MHTHICVYICMHIYIVYIFMFSLSLYIYIYIYVIYSFIFSEHVGLFHLTVVNKATVNTGVQQSLQCTDFFSFVYLFLRNLHTAFHNG